jgi:hypothetical protein
MANDIPTPEAFRPEHLAAAEEATDRFYADYPQMVSLFGDRKRSDSVHDFASLFRWAASAVEFSNPTLFRRNALWLYKMLERRNFPRPWFIRQLELVKEGAVKRGLMSEADADRVIGDAIAGLR